jgi:hypothetical protein
MVAGRNPPLNSTHVLQNALIAWLAAEGVTADWTEDVTQLSNLSQYKAVIFASNSRDALWAHGRAIDPALAVNTATSAYLDAAKVNLRQYMRAGGGFVRDPQTPSAPSTTGRGTRACSATRTTTTTAPTRPGTVQVVSPNDPSTAGLPIRWDFADEWYNLVPFPTNVKFLATVDENTLATQRSTHPDMAGSTRSRGASTTTAAVPG